MRGNRTAHAALTVVNYFIFSLSFFLLTRLGGRCTRVGGLLPVFVGAGGCRYTRRGGVVVVGVVVLPRR